MGGGVAGVPLDELAGGDDVFGDGLLGQDVLAGAEGLLDVGWLDGDGERDDDGADVGAREEFGEGFAVVGVEVDVGEGGGDVLGGLEGARVDCFELEIGARLDGWEVLFFHEDS